MRTFNKEATSVTVLTQHGDDCEQVQSKNTKILQRASLKIDLYLIPLMGMFCVSFTSTSTSSAHLPFRSFVILGKWFGDRASQGLKKATWLQDRSYVSLPLFIYTPSDMLERNIGNARVAGLTKSLDMTDKQFSMALTIT
jgi:hypothetical protein